MRDGEVRSYGVMSARETITEALKEELANKFNEKVLVPLNRGDAGHISVTTKAARTSGTRGRRTG